MKFPSSYFAFLIIFGFTPLTFCLAADKKPAAKDAPAVESMGSASSAGIIAFRAPVLYHWKPESNEYSAEDREKGLSEFFRDAKATAPTEAEALARLKEQTSVAEAEAMKFCKAEHESKAGCIRRQMSEVIHTYRKLDFAARNVLTDKIEHGCAQRFGKCLKSSVGETQRIAAEPPPVADTSPAALTGDQSSVKP